MKKIALLFFILIHLIPAYSQTEYINKDSINTKIEEYSVLAHTNPLEAKSKLSDLKTYCAEINYEKGILFCSRGLVLMYYNGGNFKKTIEECQTMEEYSRKLGHIEYLSDALRMKALSYSAMGFLNDALNELKKSLQYSDKIEIPVLRFYKKALVYEGYASVYSKKENIEGQLLYRKKSVEETKKMPEIIQGAIDAKYQNLAYQYSRIGLIYSKQEVNDSANYYFEEALKITEDIKYNVYTDMKAELLSDIANFHASNEKYGEAISFAKRAEVLEKQAPMAYVRRDIFKTLFKSYTKTDKKDSSIYYLNLYTSLNDSLIKSEKESIMTPVKQIISDNEAKNKHTIKRIFIISGTAFLILILIGFLYLKRRDKITHQKYDKLIARINDEKVLNNVTDSLLGNNDYLDLKTTINITDETIKTLLQKLIKFEKTHKYLRQDISLSWLENHLNTNTKYLREIIKIRSDKTFTNYINGLRIDYITKKLMSEPVYREYKIEYLAQECGFGSRQIFVIAFKKETGFTPSYFIENLKKEISLKSPKK